MGLKGKYILFFGVSFFGYEKNMKLELERQGAIVHYYNERSISLAFQRALLKIHPAIFYYKTKKYYLRILDENMDFNPDYIFFWGPDMVFGTTLKKIKLLFPKSELITYLSDSVISNNHIMNNLRYFDRIITYDRIDYIKLINMGLNVQFRPLFFVDDYSIEHTKDDLKYDITFIGTIHSDRYDIIKEISEIAESENYNFYTFKFLQAKFMYYYYKFLNKGFRNATINDFDYEKKSAKFIANIYNQSKCILDMQFPKNNGLTMRTIETMASKKKLITTNKDIKEYKFYNPNNILIIDRQNIKIDPNFLKSEFEEVEDIMKPYSLEEWIKDIFLFSNQDYIPNLFLEEDD